MVHPLLNPCSWGVALAGAGRIPMKSWYVENEWNWWMLTILEAISGKALIMHAHPHTFFTGPWLLRGKSGGVDDIYQLPKCEVAGSILCWWYSIPGTSVPQKAATRCRCLQKRWMLQVTIPDFEHSGHLLLGVCETEASSISNSHLQDDNTRLPKAVLPVSFLIWFTFPWDSVYDILCVGYNLLK